jgi:hypothetical protein
LLVGRLSDFFNFFSELEEGAFEELLEGECLALVWYFFFKVFNYALPMAIAD